MIRGFHYDEGNYYEDEDEDEEEGERIFINLNNYTEDEIEIKSVARRIRDEIFIFDEDKMMKFLFHSYKFKVVKEYDDIYIEVRSCLDGEVCMTIDAKKIIQILNVPLEEWGKKKKLEPLIRWVYVY